MPSSNFKLKAIYAMLHSFLGSIVTMTISLVVGIILARQLNPSDYGLLGMVAVFITISHAFVDSGLTTALIREREVTNVEYSTVFYYNLFISVVFYVILFYVAEFISTFFNEPSLVTIIRVVSLSIIVNAFGNIQRTKLIKELNFKSQMKIDVFASILSSIIGVYLAYNGYGVWALILMTLSSTIISSTLLLISNKWVPLLVFDKLAFKRLFRFGYKMLITGLLATLYHNIYNVIIGRSYSTEELGYYSKSKNLKDSVTTFLLNSVVLA